MFLSIFILCLLSILYLWSLGVCLLFVKDVLNARYVGSNSPGFAKFMIFYYVCFMILILFVINSGGYRV